MSYSQEDLVCHCRYHWYLKRHKYPQCAQGTQREKWKSLSFVQLFATPWTLQSMEFSRPEYWSGQPFPSPGIFQTPGSNPGLPHCRQTLYQLSHKWSPRILEWVADPFSRGSSRPRIWTGASCIAGRFFTNWAIREAPRHTRKILL